MTNTIYFYNTIRDYYDSSSSASSSFREQTPQHDEAAEEVKVEAASSLYTAIDKVSLIQLEQQDDDNSTTATETFLQTISGKKVMKRFFSPLIRGSSSSSNATPGTPTNVEEPNVEVQVQSGPNVDVLPPQSGMNQHPFRTDEKDSSQKLSSKFVSPTPQCSTFKCFNFAELKTATRNFCPSAELNGGFGLMFKGWVDEHKLTATELGMGIPISVKVLNQEEGLQDHTEWLEEVNYLGHFRHPNLVRLLGYCLEDTHRVLVYEFALRGSLENLLKGPFPKVSWSLWLNVALDIAKGLAFLHGSKIIHGDLKPSNILLDSNYNAKLFGFGLTKNSSRFFPIGVMETPIEDFGYSIGHATVHDAPECRHTGEFSAESDVYSFGVIFLEILFSLVDVLDSCTNRQLKSRQMAVKLALLCVSVEVEVRPTMDVVIKALKSY